MAFSNPWLTPWLKGVEIAMTAPRVVAQRVGRMTAAGAAPTAADQAEMVRMTAEKAEAWVEASVAMAGRLQQAQTMAWGAAWGSTASLMPGAVVKTLAAGSPDAAPLQAVARKATRRAAGALAAAAPGVANAGLEPVRARVAANAKRLKKG